jgi:tRNA pseudouridine55 synthase
VRHGRQIDADLDGLTALFAPDGEFLALYEPHHGTTRAVAVFV